MQDISLDSDNDGSDRLVLDGDYNDDSTSKPRTKRSLGLALAGQLGQGPISLRSAASSPGSRIHSPAVGGGQAVVAAGVGARRSDLVGREESDDGELIMDDVGDNHSRRPRNVHKNDADDDDDEEDDNDDVEDLHLPSPVREHRPSISGPTAAVVAAGSTNDAGTADEDDELEKQMLMAMEEDEDEGVMQQHPQLTATTTAAQVEEEEESEEE